MKTKTYIFEDLDKTLTHLGIGMMIISVLVIALNFIIGFIDTGETQKNFSDILIFISGVLLLTGGTMAGFFSRRIKITRFQIDTAVGNTINKKAKSEYRKFRIIKFFIDDILGIIIFTGLGIWMFFSITLDKSNVAGWGLSMYLIGWFLFLIREWLINRTK